MIKIISALLQKARKSSLRVRGVGNHLNGVCFQTVGSLALLAVTFLLFSCSPKAVTALLWQERKVMIDGAATDWETPLNHRSKDAKIQYSLSNDSENLYFCLMASDDQTQMKILMNGLELAIDTTGGKKKHLSIKFPLTQEKSFSDRGNALEGLPDIPKLRNKLLSEANEIEVKGFFTSISNGRLPLQNSAGIDVRIGWDSYNIVVYEAKIPLAAFSLKNPNSVLGVSININGLPQPQLPSGMPSGARPRGGGMPGGGMPPSGMPRMDNMSLFESLSAYLKITLAKR
jgi:hypothetical protein